MKKRFLSIALALILCLSLLAACGGTPEEPTTAEEPSSAGEEPASGEEAAETDYVYPEIEFTLTTLNNDPTSAPNFNCDGEAVQLFVDLVEERSGGNISINMVWSGALGNPQVLLTDGTVEMTYACLTGGNDPRIAAFNLPNLITSYEMAWDLMGEGGEFYEIISDIYEECNTVILGGTPGTGRDLFNNKREVHLPEDCSDIAIRVYNDKTVQTYWGKIALPVNLSMSEVYTGLQMKSIDGFEHSPVTCLSNNLQEVSKYYTDLNWQWQFDHMFLANMDFWNTLDEQTQTLLRECAQEANQYYYDNIIADEAEAQEYLAENGVQCYTLTEEERAVWDELAVSLYDEFGELYGCPDLVNQLREISDNYKATH